MTMDYCALADVKTYGGITSATTDEALSALIKGASAFIDQYCNRDFAPHDSVTETRNGHGGWRLIPLNTPIRSVTAVTVNGTPISAASGLTGDGYVADADVLYLRNFLFCYGVQNVTISYSGGFTTVPEDIKQACIDLVLFKFAKRDRVDKDMETLQGQNVSFSNADMPAHTKTALNQRRRWQV